MSSPSVDYRRTQVIEPKRLTKGLDAFVHSLVGVRRRAGSIAEELEEQAVAIRADADQYRHISDRRLKEELAAVRASFRRQSLHQDEAVPKTLCLLVEVADRTLALRPYAVQVMGAMALHEGYLAEMATGEGKSLTAALAAVMAGWSQRPCHILTVNDYLAGRDAGEFAPFYEFCGVGVASVLAEMEPQQRQRAYAADVVYTTSKELLADFLRDRLKLGALQHGQRRLIQQILQPDEELASTMVLRGIDTAIVDEADSVLIDEAVTPLIISAPRENELLIEAAQAAHDVAGEFVRERDYTVDRKYREIRFTDDGYERLAEVARALPGMWRGPSRREEIVKQALTARELYHRDQHYVVIDDKVVIVDEFTGRLMPNRSWGHGLHQAVEAQEGVPLTNPTETLARLSFQRFFRLFRKLSGTTGTAMEAAEEFWHIYRLPVLTVPTNRPNIRADYAERIYFTEDEKWEGILEEIRGMHALGRPVLVGTRSVNASERLSVMLEREALPYRLLNATHHAEEAAIVAAAGQVECITIATNMAGRGTDIKLAVDVRDEGGLHVIVAEHNNSARIDRQLIGRCARQGDPGSCRMFASLEDHLATRFLAAPLRRLAGWLLERPDPRLRRCAGLAFRLAQRSAQGLAYRQRKSVLRMDTWLEEALSFTGRSEF